MKTDTVFYLVIAVVCGAMLLSAKKPVPQAAAQPVVEDVKPIELPINTPVEAVIDLRDNSFETQNENACDHLETYSEAYNVAKAKQKPLLVMLTAKWCQPCQQFKQQTLDPMDRSNEFDGFVFVKVDVDDDQETANKIFATTGKRSVPQLVSYYEDNGPKISHLQGKQSVEKVRELLIRVRGALVR
jgi:thiol:disulfide interchange protein